MKTRPKSENTATRTWFCRGQDDHLGARGLGRIVGRPDDAVLVLQDGNDLAPLVDVIAQGDAMLSPGPRGQLECSTTPRAGTWHQGCLLALLAIELRIGCQIAELAGEPETVQSAGLVQLAQDGVTGVLQLAGSSPADSPAGLPDQ